MYDLEKKDFKNKERLIDSAISEFSRYSFNDSSLNRIVKKAEISKGSFYFHFKDKKSLYIYIFNIVAKKKVVFIEQRKKRIAEKIERFDIFEVLKEYAKIGFEFMAAYPEYHRLGAMFFKEKGNDIYEEVKNMFSRKSDDVLNDLIDIGKRKGEIRKDFTREFIVKVLNGLLNSFDDIFELDFQKIDIKKVTAIYEDYIDFIKNGLGSKKE